MISQKEFRDTLSEKAILKQDLFGFCFFCLFGFLRG